MIDGRYIWICANNIIIIMQIEKNEFSKYSPAIVCCIDFNKLHSQSFVA